MSKIDGFMLEKDAYAIDYELGEIYAIGELSNDLLSRTLSIKERYPFKENGDKVYFQIDKKFYKVSNSEGKALEISEKEYNIMSNITVVPNDSQEIKYIIATIVEDVIQENYGKKISISEEKLAHAKEIITKLNPKIKELIDIVSKPFIDKFPKVIIIVEFIDVIKVIYDELLKENLLIIEGQQFTIDYSSMKIYKGIISIFDSLLEDLSQLEKESYIFKEKNGILYFQIGEKYYRTYTGEKNKKAFEISKFEFEAMVPVINKPKGNLAKKNVILVIIDKILQEKYNKKILLSNLEHTLPMSGLIIRILHNLNSQEERQVNDIALDMISRLPEQLIRSEYAKNIKDTCLQIFKEYEENIKLLLDSIYEKNKEVFENIYNSQLKNETIKPERQGKGSKLNQNEINHKKREKHEVKLTLPAGKATPAPPVGTVLGPSGIDIHKFCEEFNEWSKDKEGNVELGVIIYDDLSYDILTKEEMMRRETTELGALLSLNPGAFKNLYDPSTGLSEGDNIEKEINPISIIRQKLETLYIESGGHPSGGEIIAIEELDCTIRKGRDLHFDQNELDYYAEDGFIHIKGTEEEFPSKSHIQLKGKDMVVLSEIKEDSEEFKYLSILIKKIDSILQPQNKTHPSK